MQCPQCASEVHKTAWICPFCEYILDPSVLAEGDDSDALLAESFETSDGAPEAVILGDVTVDPDDFQLIPGAGTDSHGRTATFLFYTTGATSRIVRPEAIPKLSEMTLTHRSPTTPYEDFILGLIDGRRTVRVIQKESGLSPQEVMISLLTLIDKRIVEVTGTESRRYRVEPLPESTSAEEPTVARHAPSAPNLVIPTDLAVGDEEEITQHSEVEVRPPSRSVSKAPTHPIDAGMVEASRPLTPEEQPDAFLDEVTPDGPLEPESPPEEPPREDTEDRIIRPRTPLPLLSEELVVPSDVGDDDVEEVAAVRAMPEREERAPVRDPSAVKQQRREAAAAARRRGAEARGNRPSTAGPSRESQPPPEAAAASVEAARTRPPTPIDPVRMAKGQKLYDQALKDKAAGNLISAKMNLKLALTFDPTNPMIRQAMEEVSKSNPEQAASRAKMFYDKATTAERLGDVAGAIDYLEQALAEAKDAAYYNRLGVLLATKKHEFLRAQELLEEALQRSPGNATYEQNLGKILQLAAKAEVEAREDRTPKKKGLLGFLGRKK